MTVRLTSSSMVHSPGLLRWAERLDRDSFSKEYADEMVRLGFIVTTWPGLTGTQALALADGKYTIEGEDIVLDDTEEEGVRDGRSD